MKKILIITTLLATVTSCSDNVTLSKKEYQNLIGDTLKPKYPKTFGLCYEGLELYDNGIVLGSDKHEYLIISYGSSGQNVEHYIDCEKCKKVTLK